MFFLLYFSFRPHSTTQPRSNSGCQKLKHRSPNFSLLCQFLQLFRGNTEAFLGQPRDYEPPPGLLLQNNILVVDLCLCKKIVVSFYVMLLCKKNPQNFKHVWLHCVWNKQSHPPWPVVCNSNKGTAGFV